MTRFRFSKSRRHSSEAKHDGVVVRSAKLKWFVPDDPGWYTGENYSRLRKEFVQKKSLLILSSFSLRSSTSIALSRTRPNTSKNLLEHEGKEDRVGIFAKGHRGLMRMVDLCKIRFQGKGEENKTPERFQIRVSRTEEITADTARYNSAIIQRAVGSS